MDIQEFPIEIVDHFSDLDGTDIQIVDATQRPKDYIKLWSDEDQKDAGKKFNLVISRNNHSVKYSGVRKAC